VDVKALSARAARASRRALAARGIEIHRTDRGMRRTLPAVLAHLGTLGLDPATVIDVGVGPGTPDLYQAFPDSVLMLVEPLEEWRPNLEAIARERLAHVAVAAAGARAGEAEIAVHRAPVCSSMIGSRREDGEQPHRSVPVVRLDDLRVEHGLNGPYVLKVDVEGGELEVLAGAPEILRESEVVLLEVSLFQLVPEAPQLHDVVAWMHSHGFVVAELYNGHNRPLDGALAQLDMAFVQEHGRFRRDHAYATPSQADRLYRGWGY
jgi:FkbM family methyltransferase